uniref:Uncharacterized protein n=1 Tax=Chlamydomonas leiostraca TaxID=1034604 RepID=A0A7S0REU6_9CHLO|eukprot:CAMPEP_0202859280 /NCGR_PEP_ID=MMETSP1391-20130828/1467_1 /ASSEMBLY_ACC=CAM_ASM_000867 /TAXON_ID=1034604 /ORGANISM="Chlamydomonas leiostraca, Strain SAG 11-49" /LENGTH=199 /DNA_ID=CAMNT_0049538303 /DNA_START=78 /DNA_END=677 /DNA_ORIENTATION=+
MAGGVSKYYERNWTYEKGGNRFEDTVGRILSRGNDLKTTFKTQALTEAKKAIAFENEQTSKDAPQLKPEFMHQTDGQEKPGVDTRGFVWVAKDGTAVAPASTHSFSELPPPPTPRSLLPTEKQRAAAYMDATSRSMHLWRKVNPGCMECNTKLPDSAYTEHYAYNPADVQPPSKERHRMKSDFTAYADMQIRYMQGQGH